MITLVYSSHKGEVFDKKYESLIKSSSGLKNPDRQLQFIRIENYGQYSLTQAYNKGWAKARNKIVAFAHNDIRFLKPGWAIKVSKAFSEGDWGILGAAGARRLNSKQEGCWWKGDQNNKLSPYMCGRVYHPIQDNPGRAGLSVYSDSGQEPEASVLVDGLFMAVHTDRVKHKFDEDFSGFHFYDLSFCLSNLLSGVNIGVLHNLEVYHGSVGHTNDQWEESRKQFFSKYPSDYRPNTPNAEIDEIDLNKTKGVAVVVPLGYSTKRKKFYEEYVEPSIIGMGADKIFVVHSQGSAPAKRNKGARLAKNQGYKYILFSDDDIVYPENFLSEMKKAINGNAFAYCGYKGIVMDPKSHPMKGNFTIPSQEYDLEKLKKGNYISTMSLIDMDYFPSEGFDENLERLQDWDLFLRIALTQGTGQVANTEFMAFYNDRGITSTDSSYSDAEQKIKSKYGII